MAVKELGDIDLEILKVNYLPRILPDGWAVVDHCLDGTRYRRHYPGGSFLVAICTFSRELDGRTWQHLSFSHSKRMPEWQELVDVKELFMGIESKAIQVFPPRSEWISIHPYCLHLWRCLDEDVIPDFTHGGRGL